MVIKQNFSSNQKAMSITGYNIYKDGYLADTIKGHYKRKVLNMWRKKGFVIKKICKRKQSKT